MIAVVIVRSNSIASANLFCGNKHKSLKIVKVSKLIFPGLFNIIVEKLSMWHLIMYVELFDSRYLCVAILYQYI